MGKSKTFGGIEVKLRTVEEFSDHVHRVLDVKQVRNMFWYKTVQDRFSVSVYFYFSFPTEQ